MGLGKAVVELLSSIILVTYLCPLSSPPANAQVTALYAGNPLLVVVNDWRFLNVTVQDYYPGRTDMVVFAVWKEIPSGQTVAVEACGIALTGGEVGNCYSPVFNIGPGTYFVGVFVISVPFDSPVSITLDLQVSV